MSLESLMTSFCEEVESKKDVLNALPNPKYQQSIILDKLIWNQEKLLKGNEKLPFTRQQAYFEAKIPRYFLR